MTKSQHLRNRLVAKYWCDKMRAILAGGKPLEPPRQLDLFKQPRKEVK